MCTVWSLLIRNNDEVVGSRPSRARLNDGSTHSCYLCQTKSMSDDNFKPNKARESDVCFLAAAASAAEEEEDH